MKKTIILILTLVFLMQNLCVPVYAFSNSAAVQQSQEESLVEKLWHTLFPSTKEYTAEVDIEQNTPVGSPNVMSEYEIYRSKVEQIQNDRLRCTEQLDRLDSNYRKVVGMCNLCSMETLLNRRVAYDFSDYSNPFDDYDMFNAIGVEDLGNGKHEYAKGKWGYYLSGGVSDTQFKEYQYTSTVTYNTIVLGNTEVTKRIQATGLSGIDAQYAVITQLLREHPEGIWIREHHGSHAIVITDYTESNGRIQLYGIDPVNVRNENWGRTEIEKLYFYEHNYFNGIISKYENGTYKINIAYLVQGSGSVGTPAQSTTVPSQPTTTVSSDTRVPTITISGQNYPSDMVEGSNFGLRGIISTDAGLITDLYGAIIDSSGNEAQVYGICPDKSTVDLQYTANNSLKFGKLTPGKYSYVVRAAAENGTNRTQKTLIEHQFTVNAAQPQVQPQLQSQPTTTVSSDTRAPTITISNQNYPSNMVEGSNFGLRGIISTDAGLVTDLYGAIIDSYGNEVQVYDICPNAHTADLQYTVNNGLLFGKLAPGTYSYIIRVAAENGTNRTQKTLIEHQFTVQAAAQLQTQPQVQPAVDSTADVPTQEVYESAPTPYAAEAPVISISEHNVPEKLSIGQNFGIRGIVSASCGNISRIYGAIKGTNGVVMESTYYPNQPSDNLRYSINNDLSFGQLNAGYYTYYVEATAVNEDKQVVKVLIESVFEVVGAVQPAASTEPQMISVDYNMRVNVGEGSTLRFCSTTSVADKYEIGSIPNNAAVYVYGYTVEKYEDRTWAKIQYNGTDGWVNYKWLS